MRFICLIALSLIFMSQFLFAGETMETFSLKNGIEVIYKQVTTVDIISLKFCSPVSVFYEDKEKDGVTSLMYSVMNKSTKKRTTEQLVNDIENLGSSISNDVEYDFSGLTLNSMSQYFDESCKILADIILNPIFDKQELEKEKTLTIESIKSRKDSIKKTANDKFIYDFYGSSHPYSSPVSGTVETVNKLTQEDLFSTYDKVFKTKGITITVVGNIKKSKLKKILEENFGKINLTNDVPKTVEYLKPEQNNETVTVDSKFNQAFIIYAYPAPNVLSKDFVTLKLISSILGGRMTGRLFVELREKLGLAYEVNSVYATRKDRSFFEVYIGLDKKNIEITKNGIEKIMEDMCNNEVSAEELKDTKSFIKGIYLLDHQAIEKQAYYLAFRQMMGLGYEYDEKYTELLEQVTAKDIIDCANRYFKQTPYKLILSPVE